MNDLAAILLEIVKVALPAFIVYLTANALFSRHLGTLERVEAGKRSAERAAETLPLRLQAYERLSVFCERIALPNLLLRLREPGQTAAQLRLSLYLAVQQEYEHNASQQVYMSQSLWDIIRQARDNTLQAIDAVAEEVGAHEPSAALARALLAQAAPGANASIAVALAAVKREAGLLYG